MIEYSVDFHHAGDLTGTRICVSDGDGEGRIGWIGGRSRLKGGRLR